MSCQAGARRAGRGAEKNGLPASGSLAAYAGQANTATVWWGDYAQRINRAVKTWRSEKDDGMLAKTRTDIANAMAKEALSRPKKDDPAGRAGILAKERARLLLNPPPSLTAGERVERVAVLDNALALLRHHRAITAAQYRAALVDAVSERRPPRSLAPVTWLPERPVGAEVQTASRADPGRKITVRYRLVELDEPVASNTPGGAPNPAYDARLQPRRRERAASTLQINAIARALAPADLLKTEAAWDDGPPIVNGAGMVESGNGRILALRRAADINPDGYAAYRRELMGRAASFGFDRAEAAGLRQPALVRERLTELDETGQLRFIAEANSSGAARMGTAERAVADARLIPPGFFADLQVSESDTSVRETLGRQANAGVVGRFFRLLPQTEQAALMDGRGRLSAGGAERLERAMFAYTLPGEAGERLAGWVYEGGEAIDRVGAGLRSALPKLGQLEDRVRAGRLDPSLRLGEDLAVAVGKLRDLRGQGLAVNDYLRQQKILPELSIFQEQLLVQLDERRYSGRRVAELLNTYADLALGTPAPAQTGMFGAAERPAKTGLFRAALKAVGGEWVDAAGWSAAQHATSGFDIPAIDIQRLDPNGQRLGALVANSVGRRQTADR